MKSMKKVYDAEEAGVWQTDVQLDSNLSAEGEMALKRNVSSIDLPMSLKTIDSHQPSSSQLTSDEDHLQLR